jgi:hemerythrin superfamily protein
MNLFEILHQDHDRVADLFGKLENLGDGEEARRAQLFHTLKAELDIHTQAEEKFFYSRLKSEEETRELVLESLDDHKDMKKALDDLGAMEKGNPEWAVRLKACRAMVQGHVAQEENDLFPKARRLLGEDEAAAMAEDIESFKEEHAELEAY